MRKVMRLLVRQRVCSVNEICIDNGSFPALL